MNRYIIIFKKEKKFVMYDEFADTNKAVNAFGGLGLVDASLNTYDVEMNKRYLKGFSEITLEDARRVA